MIGTNIYLTQETQESLIKAAALQQMSVEELATSLLRETIQEKFGEISYSSESQRKFAVNPLRQMQPYAYLAAPNEPAISPDDWEMNQDCEVNDLRSFLILIFGFGGITMIQG